MNRSEEFLKEIRKSTGLPRAVLQKITVEGREATFRLLTDVTYSAEDFSYAEKTAQNFVPVGFVAKVKIVKSVPDEEGIRRAVADILKRRFPAAAAFVTPNDIEIACDKTGGRFFISVDSAERAQFTSGDILNAVSAELSRNFCGSWFGNVRTVEKEARELEKAPLPPQERVLSPRFFPIENVQSIDNMQPKRALYIADLSGEAAEVTLCGAVQYLQEKETSKGKPFFSFTISDGSAAMRLNYFSKKATLEKVREIKVGDWVCFTGDNELYNGALSFRAKGIDLGTPPQGFVPEERPSREVPASYKVVFPVPESDMRQAMLFGEKPLPADFVEKQFVVFDLETTGLNAAVDRITEVGAVKIKEGRICERFSTFVACPVKLSQEIIELTGITDEMLVGAPDIKDVIADFYKFCDGCILVGHNVQFDYKFIRQYGEQEGYLFHHKQYDTWAIAQEVLRLSNYKLNTIADHYGFTFNHHRAYADAFVTAQIFTELIKEKKCLPKN